ncbi:DUF5723 family protein [Algibacter pectinivorans]|uniref:Thrombospondin type 3 repeat-containing protein n=1 Tax=Algibacter pectinivorans TaxID=870482 RepID=A0A1I1P8W0_9FLAO|nr:DUF5723 family protein [Algibacter pectinivorans]SFD02450.1 Thrombospondin type 3 repeat-containing protein [Algibacter pectinivorans]
MKKISILLVFIMGTFIMDAQSYLGFLTDNYSGVHSLISNPANITDSRFKTDINLGGASVFGGNNYYGINVWNASRNGYSFDMEAKINSNGTNSALVNADILGPSFMFNLSKNSSVAVFTRARAFVNANDFDDASIAAIDDDSTRDFILNEAQLNVLGHSWGEVGITYARTLINKNKHFLKGGVSLKYLQGFGSAFVTGTDIYVDYDADGTAFFGGETTGSITTSGDLTYARSAEFDNDDYDIKLPDHANGVGVDVGFVYELRPSYKDYKTKDYSPYNFKHKNKYKLKVGVSITDIGFVDYKDAVNETFDVNFEDLNQDDYEDTAEDLGSFLNSYYIRTNTETGYKIDLPTALHLNVDWSLSNTIYLNLNTDYSLISKNRITANRVSNLVSFTPRYESKWFSFYVPFTVIENKEFRVGYGFRAGPVYAGSGSILSAFGSDNNRQADVYAGVKVPVYQNGPSDKDGDGIYDKLDNCPKEFGPVSNNGCPIKDQDNDGIVDGEDACPDEVGPEENKGCPWGDKDNDGILDNVDECPELAGNEENNGCPFKDTDGDGVYDKDDDCIDQAGSVANNGCPKEVIEKLQNTLNNYAKVIFFNYGKSTLKPESSIVLADIITVLNEYPNSKFVIEGHTDSIGSYELNQRLSETRANAVKNYLIEHGIDPTRLSAIGYGEKRPIATNMYKAGRLQNRRVEIKLVN